MFWELFTIMAPLFVSAGVGFAWARLGRPYDIDLITSLVFFLGTPCLVFSTLLKLEVSVNALGQMAGAAVVAVAGFMAVAAPILKLLGLPFRAFLPALSFPNAGNMGLPLCYFAFGDPGLALAIGYFAVTSSLQFTVGLWISSGEMSPKRLLRTPLLYAVAISLPLMITGTRPPVWIANTTELIGGMTIPLMLISLGVSLGHLRVSRLSRSLGLSLLRLGMGAAGGFALAWVLGFEGAARGVVVLQSAMPVAVFNFLFAQRFARAPEEVASVVVVSALLSFATLPLLLALVL